MGAGNDGGDDQGYPRSERRVWPRLRRNRRGHACRSAEIYRGRGGPHQPPDRAPWAGPDLVRRGRVAVPPLRRLCHRAGLYSQAGACGAGAVPGLPAVPGGGTLSRPHPHLGLRAGRDQCRGNRLCGQPRPRFRRPRDPAGAHGHARRRRLHHRSPGGDSAVDRHDHAHRGAWFPRLCLFRAVSAAALDTSRL